MHTKHFLSTLLRIKMMCCCLIHLSELQRVFLCFSHTWLWNKMYCFDRLHTLMFHFASCNPQPWVRVGLGKKVITDFGPNGFSFEQKRFVLLTEAPLQPNLLFPAGAALKYARPTSSPPHPPPSPLLCFHFIPLCSAHGSLLHPSSSLSRVLCCVRHLHSWKAWREQVLSDTETVHTAHPLTAQVLRESQGCLSFFPSLPFWPFLRRVFVIFSCPLGGFITVLLPCLRAETGPWIWAVSPVSNLLMPRLCNVELLLLLFTDLGFIFCPICVQKQYFLVCTWDFLHMSRVLVCVQQWCCRSVLNSRASVRAWSILGSAARCCFLMQCYSCPLKDRWCRLKRHSHPHLTFVFSFMAPDFPLLVSSRMSCLTHFACFFFLGKSPLTCLPLFTNLLIYLAAGKLRVPTSVLCY